MKALLCAAFVAISASQTLASSLLPAGRVTDGMAGLVVPAEFAASVPVDPPVIRVGNIDIVGPWSRASQPGSRVGSAYFLLRNTGTEPVSLVSVTTSAAERAEIVHMPQIDGTPRVVPLEGGLEVPAGGKVDLRPGNYMIRLLNLKQPLYPGTTFPLDVAFSDGSKATLDVVVWDVGTMRIIAQ